MLVNSCGVSCCVFLAATLLPGTFSAVTYHTANFSIRMRHAGTTLFLSMAHACFLENGYDFHFSSLTIMAVYCDSCSLSSWEVCNIIFEDNETAIDIFQDHGVLKRELKCPKCSKPASLVLRKSENRLVWRCQRTYVAGKKKRKPCAFYSSFKKGSFLDNSK